MQLQGLLRCEETAACNCDNGVLTTCCDFEADPDIVILTRPDARVVFIHTDEITLQAGVGVRGLSMIVLVCRWY
jgi:hypothetical protein